ncbi:MAG TPA: PEP/pyruvate-binding domain-containing protein [Gemmatimonadaceae bacterium]|nr:PEP/pyruvate-binding domain-containing protein [Gemmatimonadaceae bacterium]
MTTMSVTPVSGVDRVTELCVPLSAATDESLVGAKACALGRLMRAGVAVPEGFVLTTGALDEHLRSAGEKQTTSTPRRGDAEERRQRESLLGLPLGVELVEALRANGAGLLALGGEPVVVRSSAIGEDGAAESFAGQLESVLDVADEEQLERAVRKVWASLWSERVVAYRAARGVPVRGMGVIVQRQIDARVAGVMFTTTSTGEMLVEYGAGVADKLVAGDVDPGRVAIDRASGMARVSRHSAECALDDREIDRLRVVGLAIETEFGAAQDVEWAIGRSGVLYVVQSRPITAPVTMPGPAIKGRRISWSNANVNENFPRPISPLLYSIAAVGYTEYFRNLAVACGVSAARVRAMERAFQRIIGVHGARMYYNLTSIHSVLRLAPFGDALTSSFDAFVGADGGSVETSDVARRGKIRQAGEVAVIVARATTLLLQLGRRIERFERTAADFAARSEPSRLEQLSLLDLRELLAEFIEIRCHKWLDASLADGAAMISYGALERLLRGAGMDASVHTSLLKAIPDVVSGGPVLRLWDLSRLARQDPALSALLEDGDARAVLHTVDIDPRFAEFRAGLQRFLDEWGFRCSEELMLTTPSFQEDPAPVVDVLRAYANSEGESPRDTIRAQAQARERETRAVASRLGFVRGTILQVLLPRVHAAIRYRERARLKQALLYSRCRRIALAMGRELRRRGTIAERDDVFFFTWQELLELTGGSAMFPGSVRALITARTAEHARLSATHPPDAFTLEEGEYFDDAVGGTDGSTGEPGAALAGTSACGGRVTGRATVLESVTQASQLTRGDVLVTKQTDPGWGAVFPLISGLVIERGGMLSHGAIIAREFGIPCIVGVKDAMSRIPSGATVTVDADRGEVHVLA